jgi:hypothetical protein
MEIEALQEPQVFLRLEVKRERKSPRVLKAQHPGAILLFLPTMWKSFGCRQGGDRIEIRF